VLQLEADLSTAQVNKLVYQLHHAFVHRAEFSEERGRSLGLSPQQAAQLEEANQRMQAALPQRCIPCRKASVRTHWPQCLLAMFEMQRVLDARLEAQRSSRQQRLQERQQREEQHRQQGLTHRDVRRTLPAHPRPPGRPRRARGRPAAAAAAPGGPAAAPDGGAAARAPGAPHRALLPHPPGRPGAELAAHHHLLAAGVRGGAAAGRGAAAVARCLLPLRPALAPPCVPAPAPAPAPALPLRSLVAAAAELRPPPDPCRPQAWCLSSKHKDEALVKDLRELGRRHKEGEISDRQLWEELGWQCPLVENRKPEGSGGRRFACFVTVNGVEAHAAVCEWRRAVAPGPLWLPLLLQQAGVGLPWVGPRWAGLAWPAPWLGCAAPSLGCAALRCAGLACPWGGLSLGWPALVLGCAALGQARAGPGSSWACLG
jgi:hypothetical protein